MYTHKKKYIIFNLSLSSSFFAPNQHKRSSYQLPSIHAFPANLHRSTASLVGPFDSPGATINLTLKITNLFNEKDTPMIHKNHFQL